MEETTSLAERRQVVVQMPTPNYSYIFLESTDLSDYCRFVNQWFDYEIKYGIKLEPTQIVSNKVRSLLIYNNDLADRDFNSLRPENFCTLMANETKVLSKVQFSETFKHAMRDIKVLSWTRVKPNSYELFFQGVLRRKRIFLRFFQILMEANKQFCPDIEGKEFGLAYIFLSLMDPEYNKLVLAEIPKIRQVNYAKIEDFVDTYVKKTKEHFDTSKLIRAVPYQGDDFKRLEPIKKGNWNHNNGPNQGYRKKDNNNFTSSNGNKINQQPYRQQQLNFIDVTNELDDSDNEEFGTRTSAAEVPDYQTHTVDNDDDHKVWQEDVEFSTYGTRELELPPTANDLDKNIEGEPNNTMTEQSLMVIGNQDSTRGCVNYTLYGKCFKGDECRNAAGHNSKTAAETRKWMMNKLSQANSQPSTPATGFQPKKIVRREKMD